MTMNVSIKHRNAYTYTQCQGEGITREVTIVITV